MHNYFYDIYLFKLHKNKNNKIKKRLNKNKIKK